MSLQDPRSVAARAEFARFCRTISPGKRITVLHDFDADGVAAGVILQRAIERSDMGVVTRVIPDRERSAWTVGNRARVAQSHPDVIFALDLGCQPEALAPGVPTCFIDHHRPGSVGPDDVLISSYLWEVSPNTSLLTWDLCSEIANVEDLDWVAAVGVLSDLGDDAPFPMLKAAKKRYTAKYLRETTSLVNAARRVPSFSPDMAAEALLTHASARELVNSEALCVQVMKEARAEVRVAMDQAKRAAPQFAGQVALVRVRSACQVHPVVAQIWRTRLPKYMVLVANDGYMPGRVNFSARSASINVLEKLRAVKIAPGEGSYGEGHDQASGGSLPPARFDALLAGLGFEA